MINELNYDDLTERKRLYKSGLWKRKRKFILERDGYECQWCKAEGKIKTDVGLRDRDGKKKVILVVHHIQELKKRPDLKLDADNLITVCYECHEAHHGRSNSRKKKWNDEMW